MHHQLCIQTRQINFIPDRQNSEYSMPVFAVSMNVLTDPSYFVQNQWACNLHASFSDANVIPPGTNWLVIRVLLLQAQFILKANVLSLPSASQLCPKRHLIIRILIVLLLRKFQFVSRKSSSSLCDRLSLALPSSGLASMSSYHVLARVDHSTNIYFSCHPIRQQF
jgi:hypothetical protein